MNGLAMLLKSFGIEIDPKEAVRVFELFRVDAAKLPQFISDVTAMLVRMDQRLEKLEAMVFEVYENGRTKSELQLISRDNGDGGNGAD